MCIETEIAKGCFCSCCCCCWCCFQASDFCDAWSHNGALPTKQNVLCDERSVWQVMESHADFQPNRRRRRQSEEENEAVSAEPETSADQDTVDTGADDETPTPPTSPTFAAPVFEYVLPSRPRYVLVLDRSTATAERVSRRFAYPGRHDNPLSRTICIDVTQETPERRGRIRIACSQQRRSCSFRQFRMPFNGFC